jgi:membrane protein CcdC involved in cytochrome C biogenesis
MDRQFCVYGFPGRTGVLPSEVDFNGCAGVFFVLHIGMSVTWQLG